jgi:hypothetical protein
MPFYGISFWAGRTDCWTKERESRLACKGHLSIRVYGSKLWLYKYFNKQLCNQKFVQFSVGFVILRPPGTKKYGFAADLFAGFSGCCHLRVCEDFDFGASHRDVADLLFVRT